MKSRYYLIVGVVVSDRFIAHAKNLTIDNSGAIHIITIANAQVIIAHGKWSYIVEVPNENAGRNIDIWT